MYENSDENRQVQAMFLSLFKIPQIYARKWPITLTWRIGASHWKKYSLFAKMGTSMGLLPDTNNCGLRMRYYWLWVNIGSGGGLT